MKCRKLLKTRLRWIAFATLFAPLVSMSSARPFCSALSNTLTENLAESEVATQAMQKSLKRQSVNAVLAARILLGIDAAFSCYLSLGGELALERCKQLDPGSARRAEAIFPLINRRAIEDAGEAAVDKK